MKIFYNNYTDDKHANIGVFRNVLLGLGPMPIITKATRITDPTSSLIDHQTFIPTRLKKLIQSGNHPLVFCTIASTIPTFNEPTVFPRFLSP